MGIRTERHAHTGKTVWAHHFPGMGSRQKLFHDTHKTDSQEFRSTAPKQVYNTRRLRKRGNEERHSLPQAHFTLFITSQTSQLVHIETNL